MINAVAASQVSVAKATDKDPELWAVSKRLEATFLAEMLKSAGLGETPDAFGGGAGEDQFASFLREKHAQQIVEGGGIGLAESIFNSLKERSNDTV